MPKLDLCDQNNMDIKLNDRLGGRLFSELVSTVPSFGGDLPSFHRLCVLLFSQVKWSIDQWTVENCIKEFEALGTIQYER